MHKGHYKLGIRFSSKDSLLIFGAGYVGKHLASQAASMGLSVYLTTRDPNKFKEISNLNAAPFLFDDPLPGGLTHIISTIPPKDGTDPVLERYEAELTEKSASLRWLGVVSTTGVYGDTKGAKVTEEAPLNATTERALVRIAVEQDWKSTRLSPHIFRLSGIYGPNQDALSRLQNGQIKEIPPHGGPVNRIHVADITSVLLTSMANPTPGEIYNVSDDEPAPTRDVTLYAAELLGQKNAILSLPEAPSPVGGAMGEGYRQVSNEKLKNMLSYSFIYPTYKEGLAADAALLEARHS